MLTDIIPTKYRHLVYALYAVAATTVGALNIADVATGKAVDVIAYLGIAVGAVAAANTQPPKTRNEDGLSDFGLVVAVVLGVLLFAILAGRL